jgi:hypothetical protein
MVLHAKFNPDRLLQIAASWDAAVAAAAAAVDLQTVLRLIADAQAAGEPVLTGAAADWHRALGLPDPTRLSARKS